MNRVPNAKQSPRLEDILNRGRDPMEDERNWRERLAHWWDRVDLMGAAYAFVLVALGLLILTLLMMLWVSIAQHGVPPLT